MISIPLRYIQYLRGICKNNYLRDFKMSKLESAIIIDVQYKPDIITKAIKNDIYKLWSNYDLGNDFYYFKIDVKDNEQVEGLEESYPSLIALVKKLYRESKTPEISKYLVRYWW